MNTRARLELVVRAAIDRGILPPTAAAVAEAARPWPLALLSALGAWLAAIPLIVAFGLLFGEWLSRSGATVLLFFGALLMAGAIVTLRAGIGHFVEQLAVPALLTGATLIALFVADHLPPRLAEFILILLSLGVAIVVPQSWLRFLAGAIAALCFVPALGGGRGIEELARASGRIGFGCYGALAVWAAAFLATRSAAVRPMRFRGALESISGGWAVAVLLVLAIWSGLPNFGRAIGVGIVPGDFELPSHRSAASVLLSGTSALAVAFGAAWMLRSWPGFRSAGFVAVSLVLAVLAAFMPALGGALLVLALAACRRRSAIAVSAAVACLWIVGAWYHELHWPLANKALVLVAAGLLLGLFYRVGWLPRKPANNSSPVAGDPAQRAPAGVSFDASTAGIGLGVVAVLLVTNLGIRQNEILIAEGRPIYLELIPVDPRSLVQGDFMRLNFRVPLRLDQKLEEQLGGSRLRAVARLDSRGVAEIVRRDDGRSLAADELSIGLTPKAGRWLVGTDAWYFREGEGARWQAARYGEFRVAADGRALLVGLADKDLQRIGR